MREQIAFFKRDCDGLTIWAGVTATAGPGGSSEYYFVFASDVTNDKGMVMSVAVPQFQDGLFQNWPSILGAILSFKKHRNTVFIGE